MTISPKITDALSRFFNQLSQQSSLSGLISICVMIGIAAPQAAIYAAGIVAVAGIAKVLLPDSHATVIGTQNVTTTPTVVVNTPPADVQS